MFERLLKALPRLVGAPDFAQQEAVGVQADRVGRVPGQCLLKQLHRLLELAVALGDDPLGVGQVGVLWKHGLKPLLQMLLPPRNVCGRRAPGQCSGP